MRRSKPTNLYTLLDEEFDAIQRAGVSNSDMASIYQTLFRLANEGVDVHSHLLFAYECWSGDVEVKDADWYKENWFFVFHKSIRQTDFFDGIYAKVKTPLLNPDQLKRRHELHAQEWKIKKEMGIEDVDFNGFEYHQIKKKFREENKDLIHEQYELGRINNIEDESVNGYLDSILWKMVHVEKKRNTLMEAMEQAFEEYQFHLSTLAKIKNKK